MAGKCPSPGDGRWRRRLFLGGGFGSYDFYALDAASGHVLWQYQTEDDGPTAAVVHEGRVAFNTESCELEVLSTAGQQLWNALSEQGRVHLVRAEGFRLEGQVAGLRHPPFTCINLLRSAPHDTVPAFLLIFLVI
jgi:hypothetical protein